MAGIDDRVIALAVDDLGEKGRLGMGGLSFVRHRIIEEYARRCPH